MLPNLWSARHLIASLTRRAYQIKFRQSFAGYLWALAPPLGLLGAGTLVFNRIAGLGGGQQSYALATMAALIPWTFFAGSVTTGIPIVYSSSNMVTRLSFPRAALPFSAVAVSLVNIAITGLLFIALSYGIGDGLPLTALWFPVLLLIEILLVLGVVLLGSALDVFARDMRLAVPLLVQLWLLLTPVMYPLDQVHEKIPKDLQGWYMANPMTGLVESFRDVLVDGTAPSLDLLLPAVIGAVLLFTIGFAYFASTESRFADVV